MKRYFDIDREVILTEDEVRRVYEEECKDTDETFAEYLNNCTSKNGSLEIIDESKKWYLHTNEDGTHTINNEYRDDAEQVINVWNAFYEHMFMTADGRIYDTDKDYNVWE